MIVPVPAQTLRNCNGKISTRSWRREIWRRLARWCA